MLSKGAPVRLKYVAAEEAKHVLQGAPNFERLPDLDEIRIVTIAGCDPIPCGGTHVMDIMEIGRLMVLRADQVSADAYRIYISV